jgi:hypothetical protein
VIFSLRPCHAKGMQMASNHGVGRSKVGQKGTSLASRFSHFSPLTSQSVYSGDFKLQFFLGMKDMV